MIYPKNSWLEQKQGDYYYDIVTSKKDIRYYTISYGFVYTANQWYFVLKKYI